MLAEKYAHPVANTSATTQTDPVRASGDLEAVLRRRARLLARASRVGSSVTDPGCVAGISINVWRRLITGWLEDRFLGRQVDPEAAAGARLAIQHFADDELASYVSALIEVDP